MRTSPNPVSIVAFFPIRSSSRLAINTPRMTNNEGMVVNNPTCVTDISGKSLVIAGMLAAITGPEEINNATDNNEYVLSFSMDIIKTNS